MSECRELRGIFENKTEKKHEVVNHYRPGNSLAAPGQDSRYMKLTRLSAIFTSRLYTPGDNPGTHFC